MSGLGFARRSGRESPTRRIDRSRARLSPWRGDPEVAQLVIAPDASLGAAEIRAWIDQARSEGYRGIVTAALNDGETAPFLACDFTTHERLHLLAVDLLGDPAAGVNGEPAPCPNGEQAPCPNGIDVSISRVRRREHDAVLALDAAAFSGSWRLGPIGLRDALEATPARQFRAARDAHDRHHITGYAITGVAAPNGYLQRIATDPALVRHGIGRALVLDAFRYLWRNGATRAYVNTQLDNTPALALYHSCGFELLPHGLSVLERAL
ncbi:MAG TPA: GNAT family N-acetyltransferase [Acidimicrobiia bacterium]|nr:GNAT family N-acetyltransferase [Acidimicrobiia bacterium]